MIIKITLSFPLGALFYSDPLLYTYRLFLNMIRKLSCPYARRKCKECKSSLCQYYKITGENFEGYPGIFFKRQMFTKRLYKENEEITFEILLIGNNQQYDQYIYLFFKEYLNYRIINFPFLIKDIIKLDFDSHLIYADKLRIITIIENKDFKESYNQMIHYYNSHYECGYVPIGAYDISDLKKVKEDVYKVNTKIIAPNGYVYDVCFKSRLPSEFVKIGIGKYNFIGGGSVEIIDSDQM